MRRHVLLLALTYFLATTPNWAQNTLPQKDSTARAKAIAKGTDQATIDYLEPYLTQRIAGDTSDHLAAIQHELGVAYLFTNNYKRGLIALDEAIKIRESLARIPAFQLSRSYYFKAALFRFLKNYSAASFWLNKALKTISLAIEEGDGEKLLLEQTKNQYHVIAANVAAYHHDFGLTEVHINAISSAGITTAEGSGEKMTTWQIANTRITQYQLQKDFKKAIILIDGILQNPEEQIHFNNYRLAQLEGNLANAYNELGNYEKSEVYIQRAEAGFQSFLAAGFRQVIPDLAAINQLKMTWFAKQGKYELIDSTLKVVLAYAREIETGPINSHIGKVYLKVADAFIQAQMPERANEAIDSAMQHLIADPGFYSDTKLPAIADNLSYNPSSLISLIALRQEAFLLQTEANVTDNLLLALKCYESIDTLLNLARERLQLTADINQGTTLSARQYDERAITIAMRLFEKTQSPVYLKKAWYIAAKRKSNLLNRYLNGPLLAEALNVPPAIIKRKSGLEIEVLSLEKKLPKATGKEKQVIVDSLIAKTQLLQQLNEELKKQYPKFTNAIIGSQGVQLSQVRDQLKKNTALIEYFLGLDSIYVFSIDRASGLQVHAFPQLTKLDSLLEGNILEANTAGMLYDRLLRQVIDKLPKKISRLQLIPDDILWKVPFSALRKDGDFLLRTYAISYAYSAELAVNGERRRALKKVNKTFAGFGISYESMLKIIETNGSRSATDRSLSKLAYLPFAEKEVETIGELLGGQVWLNEQASKEKFLKTYPNFRQLHLATHGLKDPDNPLENALILSSGVDTKPYALLSSREILGLDISALLVVLSACHTGAGPLEANEGAQSMARAFTFAGAGTTLASNWEASDQVTHDILIDFYQEVQQGTALDQALQRATLRYLDHSTPAYQVPELWANLTLTGAIEPIHKSSSLWSYGLIGLLLAAFLFWGLMHWKK